MSGFLTPLIVEYVEPWAFNTPDIWVDNDGTSRWRPAVRFDYYSDMLGGTVKVEAGFHTDAASVPVTPFLYAIYGNRYMRPSLTHDYLCRMRKYRRTLCDQVFLEAMRLENALEIAAMRKSGIDEDTVSERASALEARAYQMYLGARIYTALGKWRTEIDEEGFNPVE